MGNCLFYGRSRTVVFYILVSLEMLYTHHLSIYPWLFQAIGGQFGSNKTPIVQNFPDWHNRYDNDMHDV